MKKISLLISVLFVLSACSTSSITTDNTALPPSIENAKFLESGTIILSKRVPDYSKQDNTMQFAPLIGYFPAQSSFLPADNELWLEIHRGTNEVVLYRGKEELKTVYAEGKLSSLKPGDYILQHKQENPLWYANNAYFAKRNLPIPASNDSSRYLRAALGSYVLYPSSNTPIHCARVWTRDVGGLKIAERDASELYTDLPIGSLITIK